MQCAVYTFLLHSIHLVSSPPFRSCPSLQKRLQNGRDGSGNETSIHSTTPTPTLLPYLSKYRPAPLFHYRDFWPGLYLSLASIQTQLLLKLNLIFCLMPSIVSNIKCVVIMGAAWPSVKVCTRLILSRKIALCTIPESAWHPQPSPWLPLFTCLLCAFNSLQCEGDIYSYDFLLDIVLLVRSLPVVIVAPQLSWNTKESMELLHVETGFYWTPAPINSL